MNELLPTELLSRWRSGDRSALDELLAHVLPWLHREVSRLLGGQPRGLQDSMDVAQDAVLAFLTKGPRFVPATPAQFCSLMRLIATNELRDAGRRQRRTGERHIESLVHGGTPMSGVGGAASTPTPDSIAGHYEDQAWVRLAMQFVPEDDRWLLHASEVEQRSWSEIAGDLGMESADAARMRAARLKPRVANILRRLREGAMPDLREAGS